jgi:nucleoside phosphorylase
MTIDLNAWHHAIHQVTGAMATRFNRAKPEDLAKWAKALKAIAEEMEAVAVAHDRSQKLQEKARGLSAIA